ncbi:hypothetical protein D3C77_523860 [compost metagenome]
MTFQLRDNVSDSDACITNEVFEADSNGGSVTRCNHFMATKMLDQGLQGVCGIEQ